MASTANVKSTSTVEPASQRFTLRRIGLLLVVLGLLITGYMTYNKLAGIPLQCAEVGMINCAVVENSAWSRVMGIPTAMLGFIAHLMVGTVLALETRNSFFREYAPLMLTGITLFALLYHCYLTFYVALTVLKALCPYCLAAHTVMAIQFVVSVIRLRRYLMS